MVEFPPYEGGIRRKQVVSTFLFQGRFRNNIVDKPFLINLIKKGGDILVSQKLQLCYAVKIGFSKRGCLKFKKLGKLLDTYINYLIFYEIKWEKVEYFDDILISEILRRG